jgi:hypothetical protein
MLKPNGEFKRKYDFYDLDVGESMIITGNEANIRSAASMAGARYGLWLMCEHVDDDAVRVTRIECPRQRKHRGKKRLETVMIDLYHVLNDVKDGLHELNRRMDGIAAKE